MFVFVFCSPFPWGMPPPVPRHVLGAPAPPNLPAGGCHPQHHLPRLQMFPHPRSTKSNIPYGPIRINSQFPGPGCIRDPGIPRTPMYPGPGPSRRYAYRYLGPQYTRVPAI